MEISRKRIRREFAPLNTTVSIICASGANSPLTQVFNAELNEYEPDRSPLLSPCILMPSVFAHAKDNSWKEPEATSLLGDIKWFVNNVDITKPESGWKQDIDYKIETESKYRGGLFIYRNIPPGTVVNVHYEAALPDKRMGINLPIKSEVVYLSTTDKSEDECNLCLSSPSVIGYNPVIDPLMQENYKVAHGLISEAMTVANLEADNRSFIKNIPLTVYRGTSILAPAKYSVELYAIDNIGVLKRLLVGKDYELIELTSEYIKLDARLIENQSYLVSIIVKGKAVAEQRFSITRKYPKFTVSPTNGTSILYGDRERFDIAMVSSGGNVVEHPEAVLQIVWKTDTVNRKNVIHNEGEQTRFSLIKAGFNIEDAEDYLDIHVDCDWKSKHNVAVDENGNILVDELGNILIYN